jgi:hypothetical protein
MHIPLRLLAVLGLTGAASCASIGAATAPSFDAGATPARSSAALTGAVTCSGCNSAIPMPAELTRAIETRLSELGQRGGVCSQYGEVIERSYRRGQITLRPYMWRVGGRLVSGEARPNGEMVLAREIDSLNVGLRTLEDVLWSVEHEAVHIAFRIASDADAHQDPANRYVRACQTTALSG